MKQKLLSLFLVLLLLCGSMSLLTSCQSGEGDGEADEESGIASHTHEFSSHWVHNERMHWRVCEVEGCSATDQRGRHRYEEDSEVCQICGRPEQTEELPMIGSRTNDSWSESGIQNELVLTRRDMLGRVLSRTHYRILDTYGSLSLSCWSTVRQEIYTYENGKLLFSSTYSYQSDIDPLAPPPEEPILSYTTVYRYDSEGKLIRADVFRADGVATGCYNLYHYNTAGELTTVYQYDASLLTRTLTLNRTGDLLRIENRDGSRQSFAYDEDGNLLRATDGATSHAWTYEGGMPQSVTTTNSATHKAYTLSYRFDGSGRPSQTVTSTETDRYITRFAYDEAGRLTDALCSDEATEQPVLTLTCRYGARGALLQKKIEEVKTSLTVQNDYAYDEEGRLTSVLRRQEEAGIPTEERTLSLTYSAGRLTKRSNGSETVEYEYGEDGALTRETVTGSTEITVTEYDHIGNPVSRLHFPLGGTATEPTHRYTFASAAYDYLFTREFAPDSEPIPTA